MSNLIKRKTKETEIEICLDIAGKQEINIETPLPFLNHMLEQLAFHANWDLQIKASGDVEVDDHHLIEDVAIALGQALNKCWRGLDGMERYGSFLLPMDECLVLAAVDVCGRPYAVIDLPFDREFTGGVATEMWSHFFYSFAIQSEITLHLKTQYFSNNHHLIEAAFKALAKSLKIALESAGRENSTKGVL